MLKQFADYVVFTLLSLQPGSRGGEARLVWVDASTDGEAAE